MNFTSATDCQDGYDAPDITDLPADNWIDVSGVNELLVHAKWNIATIGDITGFTLVGTNFDDKSEPMTLPASATYANTWPYLTTTGSVIYVFKSMPKWVCWRPTVVTGTGSTSAAFQWRSA